MNFTFCKTVTASVIIILCAVSFSGCIYYIYYANIPDTMSLHYLHMFDPDPSTQKRELNVSIGAEWNLSLIQQRETLPPKCENSTHKMLKIVPVDHNWAPYYFRCNFDQTVRYNAPVEEGFFSKELGYLHVYKAGGTTMQTALWELLKSNKLITLTPYNMSMRLSDRGRYVYLGGRRGIRIEQFLKFIDDQTMMFSFVRDPIDKFLSAFYEANRRKIYKQYNKFNRKTGIESMRAWLKYMLPKSSKFITPNFHALPNALILKKVVPFQFIGDLYHLNEDIAQVLNPFLVDDELLNNSSLLMNDVKRNRGSNNYATKRTEKFNIDRAELSDNDIANICKIYWIDYICFPFDIPKQCDISYLFEQHYRKHVHYDPCY